jgi:hypothetical protein
MDSAEIVLVISSAFVFPSDLVKPVNFEDNHNKIFRSRPQKPLAHRLRYASVSAGKC